MTVDFSQEAPVVVPVKVVRAKSLRIRLEVGAWRENLIARCACSAEERKQRVCGVEECRPGRHHASSLGLTDGQSAIDRCARLALFGSREAMGTYTLETSGRGYYLATEVRR